MSLIETAENQDGFSGTVKNPKLHVETGSEKKDGYGNIIGQPGKKANSDTEDDNDKINPDDEEELTLQSKKDSIIASFKSEDLVLYGAIITILVLATYLFCFSCGPKREEVPPEPEQQMQTRPQNSNESQSMSVSEPGSTNPINQPRPSRLSKRRKSLKRKSHDEKRRSPMEPEESEDSFQTEKTFLGDDSTYIEPMVGDSGVGDSSLTESGSESRLQSDSFIVDSQTSLIDQDLLESDLRSNQRIIDSYFRDST